MKTIIFVLLAFTVKAQTSFLERQVETIILQERKTLIPSEEAEEFAGYLVRYASHEKLFNQAFDTYQRGDFYSVDVFLHNNIDEIIYTVRYDQTLSFRAPEVEKVGVAVRLEGENFVVVITSYDR